MRFDACHIAFSFANGMARMGPAERKKFLAEALVRRALKVMLRVIPMAFLTEKTKGKMRAARRAVRWILLSSQVLMISLWLGRWENRCGMLTSTMRV